MKSIIKIIQHGDLQPFNLLCVDSRYLLIDFESVDYHFVGFDVLFYIVHLTTRFGNDSLLKLYYAGHFDPFFSQLFKKYGLTFDKRKRPLYVFVVLYETYKQNLYDWILHISIGQYI